MTGELRANFTEADVVEVADAATDARYTFRIVADGSGRRHLQGPRGSTDAMAHGGLIRQACTLAQSEALHAGKIDY